MLLWESAAKGVTTTATANAAKRLKKFVGFQYDTERFATFAALIRPYSSVGVLARQLFHHLPVIRASSISSS